ncbi:MAG TPA: hypothetical protein VLH08_11255, partial [Acidobacteriota bacterium]|nr:hypothetical protein [Acidobacteriota bacterium]
ILAVILSLALGFVVSVVAGILAASVTRQPRWLGFTVFSPWLVTWQQIFDPTPLKLAGTIVPIWPFYLALYALISLLFLCWARNALDTRKLERNPWVRLVSLILINSYVLIGVLCWRSHATVDKAAIADFFDGIMVLLLVTLPAFAMGVLTDRDEIRFRRRPLLESLNFRRIFLNDPFTGMLFLIMSILVLGVNVAYASGVGWSVVSEYVFIPFIWIMPWFFIFIALRLFGFKQRGLFIAYVLGTIFYSIISAFDRDPAPRTFIDFLVGDIRIAMMWIVAVPLLIIAMIWSSKRAIPSRVV